MEHEEIIDGVRVIHKRGNSYEEEKLEMYDANGNRFYSNCSSLEEAQELIEKLKAEGKNAVIGPKTPWIVNGKPVKNQYENAVGVYIVKAIEEQQKSEPENNFRKSLKVHEEIIDGVRIVHTGKYRTHYSHGYNSDKLEMYDANGNRFYSNCPSLEEAQELIEKLKAEGKNAVIGPKTPWIVNGNPVKNQNENAVGVYIVKAIEEQQKSEPENEKGE